MKFAVLIVMAFCTHQFCAAQDKTASEPPMPDIEIIRAALREVNFEPVRVKGNPSTEADFWLLWRGWIRRVLLEPMKAKVAAKPWGPDAVRFAEKALAARWTPRWTEDSTKELVPEARKLIAAGADDAVVLWLAVEIFVKSGENKGHAREVAHRARDAFRSGGYSEVLGAILFRQKADIIEDGDNAEAIRKALRQASQHMGRSLQEKGTWDAAAAPFYINFLQEALSGRFCRENTDRTESLFHPAPGIFPLWTGETLAGMWEVEMGWRERGSGTAGDVPDGGWEKFGDHLEKAEKHLRRAWELEPRQPYAAWRMIAVAMAGGVEDTPRLWFDRAVTARIDFSPAWTSLSWALRPRWGGDIQSMVAVGLAAAETQRFDTAAPFWLIYATDKALQEFTSYSDCEQVYRIPVMQAALQLVFDGYYRHAANAGDREHFAWWRVVSGWLSGRYAAGEAALADTGSRPMPLFARIRLARYLSDEIRLRGEFALARTGNIRNWDLRGKAYEKMDIAEAARLLAAIPRVPEAVPMLDRMSAILGMEKQLAAGEWLKLTADAKFTNWYYAPGRWRADGHGNIINTGDNERAILTHMVKIGTSFEARGSFYCPVKTPGSFDAGVTFSRMYNALDVGSWVATGIYGNNGGLAGEVTGGWHHGAIKPEPVALDHTRPIPWALRVENGVMTWSAGGKLIYNKVSLTQDDNLSGHFIPTAPNARFGFVLRRAALGVETMFSPVEIRRLK
jgi:hypothetical protein